MSSIRRLASLFKNTPLSINAELERIFRVLSKTPRSRFSQTGFPIKDKRLLTLVAS